MSCLHLRTSTSVYTHTHIRTHFDFFCDWVYVTNAHEIIQYSTMTCKWNISGGARGGNSPIAHRQTKFKPFNYSVLKWHTHKTYATRLKGEKENRFGFLWCKWLAAINIDTKIAVIKLTHNHSKQHIKCRWCGKILPEIDISRAKLIPLETLYMYTICGI